MPGLAEGGASRTDLDWRGAESDLEGTGRIRLVSPCHSEATALSAWESAVPPPADGRFLALLGMTTPWGRFTLRLDTYKYRLWFQADAPDLFDALLDLIF